jgi:hypothetical protein
MAKLNMSKVRIFVPYVNEKMARRFFEGNPNLKGIDVELIDNRVRGAGLPCLYNEIIERYLDEDVWLFFVHEDFEVQGRFFDTTLLPAQAIYGTFGVRLKDGFMPVAYGQHRCSNKDGSDVIKVGLVIDAPTWVETLDCQSVLVHTSMLRDRPRLRFDESLTFDLYAEDFCIRAQETFGLPALVVPLQFQHYSKGKVSERYWKGLRYLAAKYPAVGVPGACSFIGGNVAALESRFTYDIPANPAREREGTG